jgi:hypothetical protein
LIVDAAHVVHETIDGEAILIHLGTGTYYSLDGVGAEVWESLANGASSELVLDAGRERYDGGLLEELFREGLLIEGEPRTEVEVPELPAGRVPFVAPVLHTYTDMQEFMLVDPLREADEVAG